MSELARRAKSTEARETESDAQGRSSRWRSPARNVWLGSIAFAVSLAGTAMLRQESLRLCGVLFLVSAAVLAVLAWSEVQWSRSFLALTGTPAQFSLKSKRPAVATLFVGLVLSAFSHVASVAAPHATFGVAGWLWLSGIAVLLAAAIMWCRTDCPTSEVAVTPALMWTSWEVALVAVIVLMGLALRVWNLREIPFNIYPDEVMTGTVAERAYFTGPPPAVFSTLWSDINLPALWFAIVAGVFKLGGISLGTVRLPAALFGAATVLPFYALLRGVWGRVAAITGASIMAFSAANVHYSRMALSNITTPFFWTVCFFFLLRALRSRRPMDWTLAGMAGGISEHFYYGTRLLPLILAAFVMFLLLVHWSETKRLMPQLGSLALGYLAGFGPLLSYFVTHPGLYYGRGASLMTWNHLPANWQDFQQMCKTLWPIISDNLLGISTESAQDIMYYAPLLLIPEAALLVLGVALLVRRWRHPAAFLLLLSGLAVLFVGGTLVLYPNSSPPMLAHWTPAFPFFYAGIAVAIGAWESSTRVWLRRDRRWIPMVAVVGGLALLGYANIDFYFRRYYANPENLRSRRYKAAQRSYAVQTVQSRYIASLGKDFRVVAVGHSAYPYDAEITRYLIAGQEYINWRDLSQQLPANLGPGKGLAFLFFPRNEQYREMIREHYPGGRTGEVRNPVGQHVFHTYVVPAEVVDNSSQPR